MSKKEQITVSVRIIKEDLARARDGLINFGLGKETTTLSAIVRNTFYGGMTLMNNDKKKKIVDIPPSQESVDFINNLQRGKTKIINVWNKKDKENDK